MGSRPAARRRSRRETAARCSCAQIEAGDREALHHAFLKLGPEARYKRFLTPIKDLSQSLLTRMTAVDHVDHEAIVALATAGGGPVGVARCIRLEAGSSRAEVAVTVADAWHRQGIGTALLIRLERRAAAMGITTFVATCLADNRDMLDVFRDLPGVRCSTSGSRAGVVEVEMQLPPDGDGGKLAHVFGHGARTFEAASHPLVTEAKE